MDTGSSTLVMDNDGAAADMVMLVQSNSQAFAGIFAGTQSSTSCAESIVSL